LIFSAPYDKFNHHQESKVKMTEVMIILLALSAITFGIGVVFLITILRDLVKILEGKK